jgi:hypothetical protein
MITPPSTPIREHFVRSITCQSYSWYAFSVGYALAVVLFDGLEQVWYTECWIVPVKEGIGQGPVTERDAVDDDHWRGVHQAYPVPHPLLSRWCKSPGGFVTVLGVAVLLTESRRTCHRILHIVVSEDPRDIRARGPARQFEAIQCMQDEFLGPHGQGVTKSFVVHNITQE